MKNMKVQCPFCKVEYSVSNDTGRGFQCAVCDCTWRASVVRKKSKVLVFLLSLFILLLAAFSLVALVLWMPMKSGPLTVKMDSVLPTDGLVIVSGSVSNRSEKLHGVPDLIVVMKDTHGVEIATQKFSPPAPLLDGGETARFSLNVNNVPSGVAKISVEMKQ